jgi:uncharacterized membrane-anchored protein YjiN (DUF445 family)
VKTRRRLALSVLLAAGVLAVAAYPVRATWWGGWILAVAEAGIVGGLADWFAVTALFRRPLGLPVPHTALIPSNWELLASRVGAMVGGRVLTREYLVHELGRVDLAGWLARGAARLKPADLERATRAVLRWAARELSPESAGDIAARLQRLLLGQPLAPALARAVELAREQGWDQRLVGGLARALAGAMERPAVRRTLAELVDEVLTRYGERLGLYPRLALGLAGVLGLLDRERIVAALQAGVREVAGDPDHPVRRRLVDALAELPGRLRADPAVAGRVEALKDELGASAVVRELARDAVAGLQRVLLADLEARDSDAVAWLAERLDRWRRALATDAALRGEVDRWARARAAELVERYHGRIAGFIEKGVRALGPEGAVRLIEEHAGDDLQYIRVNGTVVGGLAGGLLYGLHLLLRALGG